MFYYVFYFLRSRKNIFDRKELEISFSIIHLLDCSEPFAFEILHALRVVQTLGVFSCYESLYIIIHGYWQGLTELPFAPLKVLLRSHIYCVARRIPSSHTSFGVALYARADEAHSG